MPRFIVLEQLRLYPIEILDLPYRVKSRLKSHGIETLDDLSRCDEEQLLAIYHFGYKSLSQVKKNLQMLNECASIHGKPSAEFIECLKLNVGENKDLIDNIIESVACYDNKQSLGFLITKIPPRPAYVLIERFGMKHEKKRTLQDIADILDITRERVRQLQERGMYWVAQHANEQKVLLSWRRILVSAANTPPISEPHFLERVDESNVCGNTRPVGFVILATHLIFGTPIPALIKTSRRKKLYRFWRRYKSRQY